MVEHPIIDRVIAPVIQDTATLPNKTKLGSTIVSKKCEVRGTYIATGQSLVWTAAKI